MMKKQKLLSLLRKKLSSKRGFSLAELLLATAIMLLSASIVARGIPVAQDIYKKTLDIANSQVLLSTAMTSLRDDIGYAEKIVLDGDPQKTTGVSITYETPRSGEMTLTPDEAAENDDADDSTSMARTLMISDGLSKGQGFLLVYDTVELTKEDDAITAVSFKNLRVTKKGYTKPLATYEDDNGYRIRIINPIPIKAPENP